MKVKAALARLKKVRARLASPVDFYAGNVEGWRELARAVATSTLANLRPEGEDPGEWAARVATAADRVSARLVRRAPVGVVLGMSDLSGGLRADAGAAAQAAYEQHPVSIEEVERWAAAGREKDSPDEPGKNLDERDADLSDTQIAWKVLTAINNERPGGAGLEAAIRTFLDAESAAGDFDPAHYAAVLQAWLQVFTPVAAQSWREWVHRAVAL